LLDEYVSVKKAVQINFDRHEVALAKEAVERLALDGGTLENVRKENRQRYEIYEGFKGLVDAHWRDFDYDRRSAAGGLMRVFGMYKDIRDYGYEMKTEKFNELVADLEKEGVIEAVESLRLSDWVAKLKEKNKLFAELVWDVECGKDTADEARMQRFEVTKLYWMLAQGIFHTNRNNTIPFFAEFENANDRLVNEYLRVVETRRSVHINPEDVQREILGWIG
jgi:hypothetical protein